uniref:Uncharacterized protein n=1 Tax=Anguilla anguilla TaxID=7936 RepID=A0A0E9PLB9_ANGAN
MSSLIYSNSFTLKKVPAATLEELPTRPQSTAMKRTKNVKLHFPLMPTYPGFCSTSMAVKNLAIEK